MPSLSGQWRSLEERIGEPDWLARAANEFPGLQAALESPDRRSALKLLALTLALAGVGGCKPGAPSGKLVPAVRQPPSVVPGALDSYATASLDDGYASGVTVTHFMGRPIKVEGNAKHPASLGATTAAAQALIVDFYDPARAFGVQRAGLPSDDPALREALALERAALAASQGEGFSVLAPTRRSPVFYAQMEKLTRAFPKMRWLEWETREAANRRAGAERAYGEGVAALPRLARADVIVAIDSDILESAPGHLRHAREFASRRNPTRGGAPMSRVYALESSPTLIGAAADHRFVAAPREIDAIIAALAARLMLGASADGPSWLAPLVEDLQRHRGRALLHVGAGHNAQTQALVHAMNETLGGRGSTYELLAEPVGPPRERIVTLDGLVADLSSGSVASLILLDCDPVYASKDGAAFAKALAGARYSLSLGERASATSAASYWSAPLLHDWESWGDARADDGVATIMQPQSLPLHGGVDANLFLAQLAGDAHASAYSLTRDIWAKGADADAAIEAKWRDALSAGVVENSGFPVSTAPLKAEAGAFRPTVSAQAGLTLELRRDPFIGDGRRASNPWLQEAPRPFTRMTWGNPLAVSPRLAARLDLREGDRVRLSVAGVGVETPICVAPGQADDHLVGLLGFGHPAKRDDPEDKTVGVNFFPLFGRDGTPTIEKLAGAERLASVERHDLIFSEMDYARNLSLAAFESHRAETKAPASEPALYQWPPEGPAQWGMSVDLNACIGCGACVVACQAENNIPVVGKEEVLRQREMHWLRVDRYYEGAPEAPRITFQPVMCMQCEEAPCEPVCPVGATVHDAEGLNVMVYNRCVGTRFCSNNCPYKVRRFNYFDFAGKENRVPESRNPDVTVRARGVMEKCTFCVQRIARARIDADLGDHAAAQGVATACQSACPTQAISFGDLTDAASEVVARKRSPLSYALLEEQRTRPRVSYEGKLRNRNPDIGDGA